MSLAYYLPQWFFNFDVILEILYSIILFLVVLFAFKIHRLTGNKQVRLLGIGFLFISISNIIESLFNILIVLGRDLNSGLIFNFITLANINTLSVYLHIFLYIFGLTILTFMTFNVRNIRLLFLMLITSTIAILYSKDFIHTFYLLSTIYLVLISSFYVRRYLKKRTINSFLITAAFLFLLIDKLIFVISINREMSYVIGHFPELIAYVLILINFYRVKKNG